MSLEGEEQQQQHQNLSEAVSQCSNVLTRSSTFQKLSKWAFGVCDHDKTGKIRKDELYAGILLVHVSLAKYAGPAACYPPTRETVNELFDQADHDNSGDIDETEFDRILMVCCAQIFSRVIVYYALIILAVPYLAAFIITVITRVDDWVGWSSTQQETPGAKFFALVDKVLTFGKLAEKVVSFVLFSVAVPQLFDLIDSTSKKAAAVQTSPGEEKSEATKKDD